MLFSLIVRDYTLWHYLVAPKEILHLWRNFVWFTDRYFSLGELVGSLFAPWRRMTEPRRERFSFEDWAGTLLINTLSRLIGFFMRSALIVTGLLAIALLTTGTIALLVLWFFAPATILLGLAYGVVLLIS